jgi:hypothetical protein
MWRYHRKVLHPLMPDPVRVLHIMVTHGEFMPAASWAQESGAAGPLNLHRLRALWRVRLNPKEAKAADIARIFTSKQGLKGTYVGRDVVLGERGREAPDFIELEDLGMEVCCL